MNQISVSLNGPLADQAAAFKRFTRHVDIDGAHIVEIGGCLPRAWTHAAARWTSVDPLNEETMDTNTGRRLCRANAESMPEDLVDIDAIFACDSFQHVQDIEAVYRQCAKVLKPAGILYTNFGPVWTAPDGAHIENVEVTGRRLDFWSGALLPAWAHMILDTSALESLAIQLHGDTTGRAIAQYLEHSPWINRIPIDRHLQAPFKAGLEKISVRGCRQFGYSFKPPPWPAEFAHYQDETCVLEQCYQRYGLGEVQCRIRDLELVLRKPARCR